MPVISFTLICCNVSIAASYMLAPEFRDCSVCSTSYDLVLGDSVTYMIRHPVSASLLSFLYMWYLDIDSDLYFRAMLRWFIVYFQFSYTCIHSGFIMYFLYDIFFTEHGYARLSMCWLSGFFHWFLAGWNLVKSSLVLAKFFLCA